MNPDKACIAGHSMAAMQSGVHPIHRTGGIPLPAMDWCINRPTGSI
jgi:hypothetical protein